MTVPGAADRLDRFVAEAAPELSRSAAARLIRDGNVLVNGLPARASTALRAGDSVEVVVPALEPQAGAEDIPLQVVYEDADLLVIDKPSGMVVHPGAGHPTGTLVHALLGRGGSWSSIGGAGRPGIVHRLDRGTSGLLVVARSNAAHRVLAAQLAARTMSRTYLAVVRGEVRAETGVLEGDLARDPRNRQRMAVVDGGRFARTRFSVEERLRDHTLLRCDLDTGRTHQIRVHLAAYGHPIAGDALYGRSRPAGASRPMLHALRLRLEHPSTGRPMEFEAPPPADFLAFLGALR